VISVTNVKKDTKPILIVTNVIQLTMDIQIVRLVHVMGKVVKAKNVIKKLENVSVRQTLKEKIVTLVKKAHLVFLIAKNVANSVILMDLMDVMKMDLANAMTMLKEQIVITVWMVFMGFQIANLVNVTKKVQMG